MSLRAMVLLATKPCLMAKLRTQAVHGAGCTLLRPAASHVAFSSRGLLSCARLQQHPLQQAACRARAGASRSCTTIYAAAATEAPPQSGPEQTYEYQAEVDRLMDMIVNSLYSNREVFLRELVSNASDALDKVRFLGLTDKDAMAGGDALEIRIKGDEEAGTITIEDTGVGMSREDLLSSLGTIARSGTAKFQDAIKKSKEGKGDANLIGQFGVGFYSSFLVADRVLVQTRSNEVPQQWRWESSRGSHTFKIAEDVDGEPLQRGTRVTLYLREDAKELAEQNKLRELIKQYSEFIQFPIKLWTTSTSTIQAADEEATAKAQEEADAKAKEEGKDQADPVPSVTKPETVTEQDWKVENDNKPLWTRPPREVTEQEYGQFFQQTFKEFLDPLATAHFNVEGTIEFTAMLFIPGMAPFEQQAAERKNRNIKLFVKRVFISDEFSEDLMPRYLNFVKGLVDSADLPLNVSREILQESRVVRTIKRQLVKRTLDLLSDVAKREPGDKSGDYSTFWNAFGRNLKLGVIEDQANRATIAKLLRFNSSQAQDDPTSLADYVSRMKEGQKDIYFMAADSMDAAASAPFVERLVQRGYEVLYLTDTMDEVTLGNLQKFEDHGIVDVTREDIDLGGGEEESKKAEQAKEELKDLTDFMAQVLGQKVEKVAVSQRLADSPAALVTSQHGYSANMERIVRAQAMADTKALEYMRGRRILEINPEHGIIASLRSQVDAGQEAEARATVELLHETALLTGGFAVDSPKEFARRIYNMMSSAQGNGTSSSSATPTSSSSSSSSEPVVDPEVLGAEKNDPWRS